MQSYTRLAIAAVAAVVVLGGGAYLLSQGRASVGASPTPGPAITPSAVPTASPSSVQTPPSTPPPSGAGVPTSWIAVSSQQFAYTAERPTDWVVASGTEDWAAHALPDPTGPAVDRYAPAAGSEDYIVVTSDPLAADETETERRARLDADNALYCQIAAKATTIDGVIGQRSNGTCGPTSYNVEISVVHDGRFYLVTWFSSDPLTETDTAIFDRFVSSFKFGA